MVRGNIPILDVQFGNVWTNIDRATFERLGVAKGEQVEVRIFKGGQQVFEGTMPYVSTFGDVPKGETLLYLNSVDNVGVRDQLGRLRRDLRRRLRPGVARRGGQAMTGATSSKSFASRSKAVLA